VKYYINAEGGFIQEDSLGEPSTVSFSSDDPVFQEALRELEISPSLFAVGRYMASFKIPLDRAIIAQYEYCTNNEALRSALREALNEYSYMGEELAF
jgi:hypothetical protein